MATESGKSGTPTATSCDTPAVGARLRDLRRTAGVTQAALAERLGTTQSAVARLEAGRQRLSLATLRRAAEALECDVQLYTRLRPLAHIARSIVDCLSIPPVRTALRSA